MVFLAILVALIGWRWRVAQLDAAKSLPELEATSKDVPVEESPKTGPLEEAVEKRDSPKKKVVYLELNGSDSASLRKVKGIGPVFAARIVKYRDALGGFKSKEELRKVYGMTEEAYAEISPQVWVKQRRESAETERLESAIAPKQKEVTVAMIPEEITEAIPLVDLNLADSATLVSVKGIGAKTASRILQYRSKVLFFHSKEQLSEVWGIYPENLERMLAGVKVEKDFSAFPRLKINEASKKTLSQHPYLSYKEAGIITAYRELHGPFAGETALQKVLGIKAETLTKMQPYFEY